MRPTSHISSSLVRRVLAGLHTAALAFFLIVPSVASADETPPARPEQFRYAGTINYFGGLSQPTISFMPLPGTHVVLQAHWGCARWMSVYQLSANLNVWPWFEPTNFEWQRFRGGLVQAFYNVAGGNQRAIRGVALDVNGPIGVACPIEVYVGYPGARE